MLLSKKEMENKMNVSKSVCELIGKTPMLELTSYQKNHHINAHIIGKVEGLNPAGSIKDRIALNMINEAIKNNKIKKGATIIEPTSGNTGIGLASVGASLGFKVILVMPDTMSKERITISEAYGAKVILTDGKLGMKGSIEKAIQLKDEIENSFIPSQFENVDNPNTHYLTTAREIYEDMDGKIDYLVAGVGTGGTISGIGKYLKEKNSNIQLIAVEPLSSPLLTKGISGPHKIQGIGANFIPKNLDLTLVDKIIPVSDEDAINTTRQIAHEEGILLGISSGAAVYAATIIASSKENENKNIVVILPDNGDRYLSNGVF